MRKKISIITINLNNRQGLKNTIDSVINQTYNNFEWIIIDGGSIDGSKEIIKKYTRYIDYWISEPDRGLYNAMNKGILASSGEYLLFLNSGDTLYESITLQKAISYIKDADFYVGDMERGYILEQPDIDSCEDLCTLLITKNLPHQSTFIKKENFIKFGLYREDKKIVSDWIFFFSSIILNNATLKKLPFIVSNFDKPGISNNWKLANKERLEYFEEYPRLKIVWDFYAKYYNINKKISNNKLFRMVGRIYINFFFKKN